MKGLVDGDSDVDGDVDGCSVVGVDLADVKGMEEVRWWFEARRVRSAGAGDVLVDTSDTSLGGVVGRVAGEEEGREGRRRWAGWEAELALPPLKSIGRPPDDIKQSSTTTAASLSPSLSPHTRSESQPDSDPGTEMEMEIEADQDPTTLLPTLLHTLGPSLSLLWKHILGRRRIMVYTDPPVEDACLFCWAVGGLCRELEEREREKGGKEMGMEILGLVTL